MSSTDSAESVVLGHIPEIVLILAFLVILLIIYTYLKDKDSMKYKFSMVLGIILGIVMILFAVSSYAGWRQSTAIIIAVAGFALLIRPFRDTDFAIFIAIVVMVVIYIFLGGMTGDLAFLTETWPRIIAAVIAGALVYGILNFVQKIAQMIGKILNWWPFLLILGLLCLIEAVFILAGWGSIGDLLAGQKIIVQFP